MGSNCSFLSNRREGERRRRDGETETRSDQATSLDRQPGEARRRPEMAFPLGEPLRQKFGHVATVNWVAILCYCCENRLDRLEQE